MSDQLLYFNGIDGDTGTYDLPPMTAEELMRVIRGEMTPENLNELRFRVQQATTGYLGVKEGVDPRSWRSPDGASSFRHTQLPIPIGKGRTNS